MSEPIHIISLGAGVQSSTMALMAAAGELTPMPVAAIFADTQAEPASVYTWVGYLAPKLPFTTIQVTAGSLEEHSLQLRHSKKTPGAIYIRGAIPAFLLHADGSRGLLGRKCTTDFKIRPVTKKCRELVSPRMSDWRKRFKSELKIIRLVEAAKKEKTAFDQAGFLKAWETVQNDPLVVLWIGISTEEAHRMKPSRTPWIKHRWPLIEHGTSREHCLTWMKSKKYPEPPRSACTFCPFHSDDEWIRLRDKEPEAFEHAVAFEARLRIAAKSQNVLRGSPFLHDTCKPLPNVKFTPSSKTHKQVSLFGSECEGMCGV